MTESVSVVYCCHDSITSTRRHRCRGIVLCARSPCTVENCAAGLPYFLRRRRLHYVLLSLHQLQHRRHRWCTSVVRTRVEKSRRSVEPAPAASSTAQVAHVSYSNTGRERIRSVLLILQHQQHHRRHTRCMSVIRTRVDKAHEAFS